MTLKRSLGAALLYTTLISTSCAQMEERNARRIVALEKELALGSRTVRQLVTALFPWVKTLHVYLA